MFKIFLLLILLFSACKDRVYENTILFGINPTEPPAAYIKNNKLEGFIIDLDLLIAKELKMKADFKQMQWANMLPALENNNVDLIAGLVITGKRKEKFDFSDPYFFETLVLLSRDNVKNLENKKIAVMLGSMFETWLKDNAKNSKIISMDSNLQAIEALKAGHVDGVLMFQTSTIYAIKKNPDLYQNFIANDNNGIGLAMKKNSPLLPGVNKALKTLKERGDIDILEKKWLYNNK